MICNKCGKEIPNQSAFCTYCGSKVEKAEATEQNTENMANKTIKVVFQRKKKLMGCAISMKVNIDGNVVALLKNGEAREVEIPAGKHKVILETFGEVTQKELDFSAEYSKVYIELVMKMGLVTGRADISSIRTEK
jgi:hypothetical protein